MSHNLASERSDVMQQALVSRILEPLISKKSVVDLKNQAAFHLHRHTTIRSLTKIKQDIFSVIEPSSIRFQEFARRFSYCTETEQKQKHLNAVIIRDCWGHTIVWDKSNISQGLHIWLRVVVPAGNGMDETCHTDQELWRDLIHLPFSPLCLFSSHPIICQDGNEGGKQSTPLSSLLSVPV